MKPRQKRMALIGAGVALLVGAVALVLNTFNDNMVFFYSPTQVAAKEAPQSRTFRIRWNRRRRRNPRSSSKGQTGRAGGVRRRVTFQGQEPPCFPSWAIFRWPSRWRCRYCWG